MIGILPMLFCTILGFTEPASAEQSAGAATQIHAFGGKELLVKVFEAMESILYGTGSSTIQSSFKLLIKLALIIGAFCALCLAFLRQKFEPLIRSFFLPGIAIIALLLVPTTSIAISDGKGKPSDSITTPFFIGKFASVTSKSVHNLQEMFSKACDAHPWVKSLYEEKNFFRHKEIYLKDATLETNAREYCRECVFRDLGLGLYTKKDLSEEKELLEFLQERGSAKRKMLFQDEDGSQWKSCKEAIGEIKEQIEAETETLAQENEIPSFLLKSQEKDKEKQKFIQQKIMIDLLKEREGSRSLASLGAFSLIASQQFFEAALYLSFPLMIILSLLSFGFRILLSWIKLVLWVFTWPILYVVVDLFLTSLWNFRSKPFGSMESLTLEKALKCSELYGTLEIVACIVLLCIPVISWLLVRGGTSQVVQLTSSLFQTAPPPATAPLKQETQMASQESDTFKQTNFGRK